MTTLYPRAVWREVTDESKDPPIQPVGAILHVSGGEAESLFGYFDGPSGGIESHLHIAREPKEAGGGGIEQYRDLDNEADANYHGNSWIGGSGHRYGYHSVETQGGASGPWNAYQLEEIARFLAWDSQRYHYPLSICRDPKDPGVGWHVMWGAPGEWTPAEGKVCPGPDRIKQVPAVIARAREIAAGDGEGDWFDMATKEELSIVVRDQLNEATAEGTVSWADTVKADIKAQQDTFNAVQEIKKALGASDEAEPPSESDFRFWDGTGPAQFRTRGSVRVWVSQEDLDRFGWRADELYALPADHWAWSLELVGPTPPEG